MEINKEIVEILKEARIEKDAGLLVLLGVYFKLDVASVCPEEVIKAVNYTKIISKDYETGTIEWNVPLFEGQLTEWDWVREWNNEYGKLNPSRKGAYSDVLKRMKEWFSKYPQYRKEDVVKATNLYKSLNSPAYYKNSTAFIFDGAGAMKKSILLSWCERLEEMGDKNNRKGEIVT